MLHHARRAAPNECCGLLTGSALRIESATAARNIADMPAARYLIEPADYFAAIRDARRAGFDVVGAYHSHVASLPVPSSTDRSEAHADFLYLIVSLADCRHRIRAWQLAAGNFVEVPLVKVP
jgi:proteasome lid subunit RPN8/RPN11